MDWTIQATLEWLAQILCTVLFMIGTIGIAFLANLIYDWAKGKL